MQKYTIVHRQLAAFDHFLERLIRWTYLYSAPPLEIVELEYIRWRFEWQIWLLRGWGWTWCPYLGL